MTATVARHVDDLAVVERTVHCTVCKRIVEKFTGTRLDAEVAFTAHWNSHHGDLALVKT